MKGKIVALFLIQNLIPLKTLLENWGHSVINLGAVGDNLDLLRDKIHDNVELVDVFVTTGGVSTGQEDFVSQFLNKEESN